MNIQIELKPAMQDFVEVQNNWEQCKNIADKGQQPRSRLFF